MFFNCTIRLELNPDSIFKTLSFPALFLLPTPKISRRPAQVDISADPHDSTQSRVPLVCVLEECSMFFFIIFFLQSSCTWLVVTDNIVLLLTIQKWQLWSKIPEIPSKHFVNGYFHRVAGVHGLARPDAWGVSRLSVPFKPIRLRSAFLPRGHSPLTSWNEESG